MNCGNEIPNDSRFCVICGAPVEERPEGGRPVDGEETVLLGPDEMQGVAGGYADGYVDGYDEDWMEEPDDPRRKRGLVIFLVSLMAALLIAAGVIFIAKPFSDDSDQGSGGLFGSGDDEVEVSVDHIEIVDSDWDWDSSRKTGGNYEVDIIMSVNNESDTAITGIDFDVNRNGEYIANCGDPDEPFRAEGYIPGYESGVMVAKVVVEEKNINPEDVTTEITKAITNPDIPEDYTVPNGYFSYNGGPGNDYYDVAIRNYNDMPVNETSTLVAVRYQDENSGKFYKEYATDATGRLSSDIAPLEEEFIQEKAFVDPHLDANSYGFYIIYVLDTEYYNSDTE